MVQVTISLDEAVVVELDAMADQQGMSRAGLVRREVLRALPALRRERDGSTAGKHNELERP